MFISDNYGRTTPLELL